MEAKKRIRLDIPLQWPTGEGWQRLARWLLPSPGTVLFILVLLWAQSAGALPLARQAAPTNSSMMTINYQGHLADNSGNPINDTVSLTFALYGVEGSGTAVWSENHGAVPVSDGLFSVRLGQITPLSADLLTENLWLEIQVDTDPPMTPREKLAAVPYAMQALTVPDESITTEKIANGAVHPADLSLDSGQACLSTSVDVDLPGGWTEVPVPGLNLSFTADQPSKVLIWMNGLSRMQYNGTAGAVYMELVIDGEKQIASHSLLNGQWDDIRGQRIFSLDAGTHQMSMQSKSNQAGTLSVHGESEWRTCLYYLVLGGQ